MDDGKQSNTTHPTEQVEPGKLLRYFTFIEKDQIDRSWSTWFNTVQSCIRESNDINGEKEVAGTKILLGCESVKFRYLTQPLSRPNQQRFSGAFQYRRYFLFRYPGVNLMCEDIS